MTLVRLNTTTSITLSYLEAITSYLTLESKANHHCQQEKAKFVDLPTELHREYYIYYKAVYNAHTVGYPIYVTLKELKLTDNNAAGEIAKELRELESSDEMEYIHGYLTQIATPTSQSSHTNVEDLMTSFLNDKDVEPCVRLLKKISDIYNSAIASRKSTVIGSTLLAHKASKAKGKKNKR